MQIRPPSQRCAIEAWIHAELNAWNSWSDISPLAVTNSRCSLSTRIYTSGEVQVVALLDGLDLEICAGEVVVLLGPSGSGKSTRLNIMARLDHATSGRLFFKDGASS